MLNRREFAEIGASVLALGVMGMAEAESLNSEKVVVDLHKDIGPLNHIWSRCGGSDRAEITMREEWRHDAKRMQKETGLQRVRFHGVLDNEMGVWVKGFGPLGDPNFQNVDAVYDGLLDIGLQPYVELSFMPENLASAAKYFGQYKGNISPPKSLDDWGNFLRTFIQHLVNRYGSAEVRQWYFEVWNEPNLPFFWAGTQADYFSFYRKSADVLKSIDPALKVGGPSTSAVQWIPQFLDFCKKSGSPLDFVSTHLYAGDNQKNVFGQDRKLSQTEVIPAGVSQVRSQIDSSPYKGAEFWLTEWSCDSPAMISHIVSHCLRYCQGMSHWTFSGVYEELGAADYILADGSNGFPLIAPRNIPKPSFNTYKLMHRLGDRQLQASGPVLASRRSNGGSAILLWNLAEVTQANGIPGIVRPRIVKGEPKKILVTLKGAQVEQQVRISYVDQERGSPFPAWRSLGSPKYISRSQLAEIREAAELGSPEIRKLGPHSELLLELPIEGVALLELD